VLRSVRSAERRGAAGGVDRSRGPCVSRDAVLDEHAFQETTRRGRVEPSSVFGAIGARMSKHVRAAALCAAVLMAVTIGIGGQAPAPAGAPAPGFDLSGFWTAAMH